MTLRAFDRAPSGDPERFVEQLQDRIEEFTKQLTTQPGLDTRLISNIAVSTTVVLVEHGLGRAFQGWRVVDINANVVVYHDSSSTADITKFLPLKASGNATIKLEVF